MPLVLPLLLAVLLFCIGVYGVLARRNAIAAAEIGLGLAIVLLLFRGHGHVDVDAARDLVEVDRVGTNDLAEKGTDR